MLKDELIIRDILDGAKRLFSQHGLKKTTMEDIAQAAGKGKSTLYYYFPGKNEIFEAVVEDEMKNLIQKVRQAINTSTTAKQKMKAFLRTNLSSIIDCKNLSKVVREEIFDGLRKLNQIKIKYDQTQVEMMKEIITGGVQSGEFRELPVEMIAKCSFASVAAFRGLGSSLETLCDSKSEEYFEVLIDTIVNGIGRK